MIQVLVRFEGVHARFIRVHLVCGFGLVISNFCVVWGINYNNLHWTTPFYFQIKKSEVQMKKSHIQIKKGHIQIKKGHIQIKKSHIQI